MVQRGKGWGSGAGSRRGGRCGPIVATGSAAGSAAGLAVALAAAGMASPALAQDAAATPAAAASEPPQVQEVIVTSQRVQTVLGRTPLSVGVLDQHQIETRGTAQLSDLVGVVPGVTVPNGFSNQPQAVGIRGVGVSSAAMSQAVGIYVDDVPIVRGYTSALWDLPDIARIEVLRGPQGTLYGQNLTAGAVRIISIDPGTERAAWVSGSLGNHDEYQAHAYFNGPIGDGPLSGSLALSRRRNQGFGYNATLDEHDNKLDASQFRAKLRWQEPAGWDAILAVDGLLDHSDTNTGNFPLNDPNAAPRVNFTSTTSGPFKRLAGGLELKLSHALGEGLQFHAITGYRAFKDDPTVADIGGLAIQRYLLAQKVHQKVFSQELQLQARQGDLDWTAGAMLVSDDFHFERFVSMTPPGAPASSNSDAITHLETTDFGLYGQLHYRWTERLGMTAGLRAYRTGQTGANQYWLADEQGEHTQNVYQAPHLSTASKGLLPRLGLDWQQDRDLFLYASFAMGQKFGGFNRAAQSQRSAEFATDPEKVTSWELGSKSRLAGGQVKLDIALFYNDYRDYLASLSNAVIDGVHIPEPVLVNAGKAKTYGADIDLGFKLAAHTDVALSAELLRTRFDQFENPTGAAASNYVGNQLPFAPQFSFGASLEHIQPLPDGSSLGLSASVQHLSRQYSDVQNTALTSVPVQTYFNLGASWLTPERGWTFSLRVRNLTNRSYVLLRTRIPPADVDAAFYNAPRTVLATVRHDF
ncbi:TonB-dependent receptor [Ideonella azotifigens]|uniref:TonB-dependent receptor n=1 Tax=Ideonella azotifigens TaxID=513160 RepID=A0ABP3VC15_9BURK